MLPDSNRFLLSLRKGICLSLFRWLLVTIGNGDWRRPPALPRERWALRRGACWACGPGLCRLSRCSAPPCPVLRCSLPGARADAEAETPVLWPPHAKSWPRGKDPDAGRDWGQEEKGATEDETAGGHHRLQELVVMDREAWRAAVHGVQRVGHDWATELNWLADGFTRAFLFQTRCRNWPELNWVRL